MKATIIYDLDIRNKLQKQWQADWQAHRQEAFRRIQMKRMQQGGGKKK